MTRILTILIMVLAWTTAVDAAKVTLSHATATHSQGGYSVGYTIDNNFNSGWAIDNSPSAQTAVWQTTSDITGPSRLTFTLSHPQPSAGNHYLGRFRLSATSADRSQFANGSAVNG